MFLTLPNKITVAFPLAWSIRLQVVNAKANNIKSLQKNIQQWPAGETGYYTGSLQDVYRASHDDRY